MYKRNSKQASEKQRRVVKAVVDTIRKNEKKPVAKIIRQAGYAPSMANHSNVITSSQGFQELLATKIPDVKAIKIHKELFKADKLDFIPFPIKEKNKDIKKIIEKMKLKLALISRIPAIKKKYVYVLMPDNRIRAQALEMFYKVRGYYVDNKEPEDKFSNLSDEELDALLHKESELIIRYTKYKKNVI